MRSLRSTVFLAAVLIACGALANQVAVTPKGDAANVRFSVTGGVVQVTYDLISEDPRAVFSITLEASDDGGRTWTVRPTSLTGDVGESVTPGAGRQIVWEAGRDMATLRAEQLQFRVSPVAVRALPPRGPRTGRLSVTTTPRGATLLIDGQHRGTTPLTLASLPVGEHELTVQLSGYLENRRTVQVRADAIDEVAIVLTVVPPDATGPKAGRRNPLKWVLIAGGGAAAIGAAAANRGGGAGDVAPPTATNRTPVITGITITPSDRAGIQNVTQFSFAANATDPDGDPMTFRWEFGDSSSTTGSSPNHIYSQSGVFDIRVTASDNRGAATTFDSTGSGRNLKVLPVTGTWVDIRSGACGVLALEQTGTMLAVRRTCTGSTGFVTYSGTVTDPRNVRLTEPPLPQLPCSTGTPRVITFVGVLDESLNVLTGTRQDDCATFSENITYMRR